MDEKTKKRDEMKSSKDILLGQLEMLHNRWGAVFQQRGNVRNWCILLWSGALAMHISNAFAHQIVYFILSFMILVVFFSLEVLYGGDLVIHERQIRCLQAHIRDNNLLFHNADDAFLLSGYNKLMSDRLKELGWWGLQIERCYHVIINQKNIPIFYGILFSLSFLQL